MRWVLWFALATFLELVVVWQVGLVIGFWPTVAIVGLTGVLGAGLAKREGLRVLDEWRGAIAAGRMPEVGLLDGLLVLLGGLLLLLPGLIGDVVGLLLLFPPTRRLVANVVRARLEARFGQSPLGGVGLGGDLGPGLGSFTVIRGDGFPGPFGDAFGEPIDPRDDRDVVIVDTTGETVVEDDRPPLLLPAPRDVEK